MTPVLVVAGLLVVAVAGYDAVLTTLAPASGAGPVSGLLSRAVTKLSPHRRRPRLLPPGTGLLLGTVATWVVLLLVGWTVALGAGPGAVVSSSTGAPTGAGSRFYYAGYTVLTLGIGDYVPRGTWAQVGTVVAAFSGLFVVTLAITYLLNVVTAIVAQRTLAAEVWLVTGTSLVTDRDAGQDLDRYLGSLAPRVIELAMRHLAYPVMHRFTDTTPDRSAVVAMALLTDLVERVQRRAAAAGSGGELLAASLDVYLDTVHGPHPTGSGGDSRRERMSALLDAAGERWPTGRADQV